MRVGCLVHFDRLHEVEIVEAALGANVLRGDPELVAKRPCECLVRAVSRLNGERGCWPCVVKRRRRRLLIMTSRRRLKKGIR